MNTNAAMTLAGAIAQRAMETSIPAPVAFKERIAAIDILRGVALLGLLLMHMPDFGLPATGFAPIVSGDRGSNFVIWLLSEILVAGKLRAIFTMLFGASVVIFTTRGEERGPDAGDAGVADLYCRRTLWLIGFGLLHAYFIWDGDVLFFYGVIGLMLFPWRKASAKALLIAALALLVVGAMFTGMRARRYEEMRAKAATADTAAAAGKTLSDGEREAQQAWAEARARFAPGPDIAAKDIAEHRVGYWAAFRHRGGLVAEDQPRVLYRRGLFDEAVMMLFGMALLKLGVFSAARSRRFYAWMTLAGYGVGLALTTYMTHREIASHFDPVTTMSGYRLYDLDRLLVALGHIGLVMLIVKAGALRPLTSRLAAVGRMALTNYLTHSIVCTLLFNGYGFGLYGKFQPYQLLYVTLALWTFQLIVSPLWLRRFHFGPAEWLWRSLTYWRRQPMKIRERLRVETAPVTSDGLV